ncbi:MAG TPA: VCBS repeat-containing protein, partial [Pyrinomonadaceae bacterium]|nr:VCBS repeat-containing protein [Pyrinomonadaceae bacterium]
GDYDGDGKYDFAVQRPGANASAQATFYILQTTAGLSQVNWGLSNDLVVPGDYDGDGKTDIAVVREGATPTANLVWYVLQSSNSSLFAVAFGDTGTDLNAQNDYDGDGKADVAIWRNSTGTFWYRSSSSGAYLATQWGTANDFPVAAYDTH